MLAPEKFRASFVDPATMQFAKEPSSVLHACTLIWCLDALASHVALDSSPTDLILKPNERENREKYYKSDLVKSGKEGSWQFHVVREASNALKHAWRRKSTLGAATSDLLAVEDVEGWLWYFEGPRRAPRWGKQVVVKLALIFNQKNNRWEDLTGGIFDGPLTNWVPVLGLIAPTVELLGFDRVSTESMISSDWT